MRLADVNADKNAAPLDPFKVEHSPQKFKYDIALHVHKITHWKPTYDGTVDDTNGEPKGHQRTLKWSEHEKMFRCDKDERILDKIIKEAMQYEMAVAASEKKLEQINNS